MILVKYNEIMNNVTVDPEMKTRIMSAVSAAIKEQNGKTEKAQAAVKTEIKKTPQVRTAPEIRKEPEQAKVSGLLTEEGTPPVRK